MRSGYVVQYRAPDKWVTYSRHRKIENAQKVKRKLEDFYAPLGIPTTQVRIVNAVEEAAR